MFFHGIDCLRLVDIFSLRRYHEKTMIFLFVGLLGFAQIRGMDAPPKMVHGLSEQELADIKKWVSYETRELVERLRNCDKSEQSRLIDELSRQLVSDLKSTVRVLIDIFEAHNVAEDQNGGADNTITRPPVDIQEPTKSNSSPAVELGKFVATIAAGFAAGRYTASEPTELKELRAEKKELTSTVQSLEEEVKELKGQLQKSREDQIRSDEELAKKLAAGGRGK